MTSTSEWNTRNKTLFFTFMTLLMLGVFALHATKCLGVAARIFPDETTYSYDTRLNPPSEALIPNYIFNSVYSLVTLFGDRFLDGARILNAFFFTLSGLFVYLVARKGCGRWLSLLITLLWVTSPLSSYTQLFMVESLYVFFFWAFVWLTMRLRPMRAPWYGAALGGFLGIMSLVKIHAIFALPGLMLFFLFNRENRPTGRLFRAAALNGVFSLAAFFIVKFGIGYCFAGQNGITLIGSEYTSLSALDGESFIIPDFILGVVYNATGHILALSLLLGAPLSIMFFALRKSDGGNDPAEAEQWPRHLAVFSLSMLAVLGGLTVCFTSYLDTVHFTTSYLEIERLQARFYNFLYPAFLLASGYCYTMLGKRGENADKKSKWFALPILLLGLTAAATALRGYKLIFSPHCPEYASLFAFDLEGGLNQPLYYLCALPLAATLVWFFNARRGAALFLFVFMPVYTALSFFMQQEPTINYRIEDRRMLSTALTIRKYLGPEVGNLTILGSSYATAAMFAFYMDDRHTRYAEVPAGRTYIDEKQIAPGSKWILLISYAGVPEEMVRYRINLRSDSAPDPDLKMQLVRIAGFTYSADFATPGKPSWPLERMEEEEDGAITLEYGLFLPESFDVSLEFPPGTVIPPDASYTIGIPEEKRVLDGKQSPPFAAWVSTDAKTHRIRLGKTDAAAPWPARLVIHPDVP